MEIVTATPSPVLMPTAASPRGTGLPVPGWYAATGDVRPRAAAVASYADVERSAAGVAARAAAVTAKVVAPTNAAVQQHLPFLPIQGTRPRGAPV